MGLKTFQEIYVYCLGVKLLASLSLRDFSFNGGDERLKTYNVSAEEVRKKEHFKPVPHINVLPFMWLKMIKTIYIYINIAIHNVRKLYVLGYAINPFVSQKKKKIHFKLKLISNRL